MSDLALQTKVEPPREARAQVVNVTGDPQKLMRVQVRVIGLWDGVSDADLPWAEYRLSSSRGRGGSFEPAEVGDWVWVDFPNGDTRYPRITGWCHYAPGGVPNMPHEAFAGPDSIVHKRNEDSGEPAPAAPVYHGSNVTEKHGVVIEINPSGEYLITQRTTGTAIRVTADGAVTIHGQSKVFMSSVSDTVMNVGGNLITKVAGNWEMDVGGTINETASQHVMSKR